MSRGSSAWLLRVAWIQRLRRAGPDERVRLLIAELADVAVTDRPFIGQTGLGRGVLIGILSDLPKPPGRWHPIHLLMLVTSITQTRVGTATGYSHTYVSLVGRGLWKPSRKYRERAAAHFGVPENLLFRTDDDDPWTTSDGGK